VKTIKSQKSKKKLRARGRINQNQRKRSPFPVLKESLLFEKRGEPRPEGPERDTVLILRTADWDSKKREKLTHDKS